MKRAWWRWRWHRVRWWRRDATWWNVHTYGCDACEARE